MWEKERLKWYIWVSAVTLGVIAGRQLALADSCSNLQCGEITGEYSWDFVGMEKKDVRCFCVWKDANATASLPMCFGTWDTYKGAWDPDKKCLPTKPAEDAYYGRGVCANLCAAADAQWPKMAEATCEFGTANNSAPAWRTTCQVPPASK